MGPSYPPLPQELVDRAHSGVSVLVGTCSAELVPHCVRGAGLRVWDDRCRLTVLVPAGTGARSLANLRDNPRIAVTFAQVRTHRTAQIKGAVLAMRDGTDEDRAFAMAYRAKFAVEMAWSGQANVDRLAIWPLVAVDVAIELVFAQTPGPVAGQKLPLPEGRIP